MKHYIFSLAVGLMIFGMNSGSANAIPVAGDYTIATTTVMGTFTSDGAALTKWSFVDTFTNITFSGLVPLSPAGSSIFSNDENSFDHFVQISFQNSRTFEINWRTSSLTTGINTPPGNPNPDSGRQAFTPTPATVPEPTTLALFATGLLGLTGYRWQQRRRERVQTS